MEQSWQKVNSYKMMFYRLSVLFVVLAYVVIRDVKQHSSDEICFIKRGDMISLRSEKDTSTLTYTFIYSGYEICKKRLHYTGIFGFSVCERRWDNNDTIWCGKFVSSKLLCIHDNNGKFYHSFSKNLPKGYVKYWDSYIYANQQTLQKCAEYSMGYWDRHGYKGSYQEFIVVLPFDSCYILKMDIGKCIDSGLFGTYERIVLYNVFTYYLMFKSQCAFIKRDYRR